MTNAIPHIILKSLAQDIKIGTSIMSNSNEVLVTIKIGRGGRFYNGGHKSIIDSGKSITDYIDDLFYDEKKNILHDGPGNELDFEFNSNGTGYINIDNQYNTIVVCLLSEIEPEKYYLIADSGEWNTVELLQLLGIKNAEILDKFNLLQTACNDGLYELEDHFIQEVSEKNYDESNYGFDDYEECELNGKYYVKENK